MKVLHVIPSVSKIHGGPSLALFMMERSLSAIGVAVTTLTTDDDGPGRRLRDVAQSSNAGGSMRYYARKWTEFYKFSPGLLIWLLRHVRDFHIIHIHALFTFSSMAAALVARIKGVPYIVRPLGTLNAYGVNQRRPRLKSASFKLIESRIIKHAAAVHFTSQAEWDEAKTLGVPLRGIIIPLGVDGPAADDNVGIIDLRPGQKVILFLSRLDPKKNVEGLLKAFVLVRQRHKNVVLVIAGHGTPEYVRSLQGLAEAEGIAKATTWIGHVQDEQKWSALARADVFVLPSFSENFGIAAVEALIAGRPCIVGSGVAIADEIARAGAGLVTEPDPSSIARALDRLLSDEAMCRQMGARSRKLAAREYSSRVMAERLVQLYSSIVGPVAFRNNRSTGDARAVGLR